MSAIKSKTYRVNRFSLLEMLAVIVMTGVLMNAALLFYYKSQNINRKYTDKAIQIKSVSAVSKYLRGFIHDNGEAFMVKPDKVVFKNGSVITMDGNRLVFIAGSSTRSFALPKGFSATFALEQSPEEPPRIATNIVMLDSKDQLRLNKFTRITACVEGGAQ